MVAMMASSVVVVVIVFGDRLVVMTSGLFFNVGWISICLICWLTVGSSVLLS